MKSKEQQKKRRKKKRVAWLDKFLFLRCQTNRDATVCDPTEDIHHEPKKKTDSDGMNKKLHWWRTRERQQEKRKGWQEERKNALFALGFAATRRERWEEKHSAKPQRSPWEEGKEKGRTMEMAWAHSEVWQRLGAVRKRSKRRSLRKASSS